MNTDLENTAAEAVDRDGYVIVPGGIEEDLVNELGAAISGLSGGDRRQGVYERSGVYALRNLFDHLPAAKRTIEAPLVREIVSAILGREAFCVRGLLLDKAPRASWNVPWHQDATVTVKERVDVTGFGPWSFKAGVQHVMAPPGTLSAMLTLRLYLDDCLEEQGAMKVVQASHQYGRLPEDSLEQFTRYHVTPCPVARCGILALRPLVLRASSPGRGSGPRRVIQLDFANRRLPLPLEWREAHPLFS